MIEMRTFRLLGLWLLLSCAPVAWAQGASVSVRLRVVDGNAAAVSAAQVIIQHNSQTLHTLTTDQAGEQLVNLAAGAYEVRVIARGFVVQQRALAIPPNDSTAIEVTFTLAPQGLQDALTVTPARTALRVADAPASVSVIEARTFRAAAAQTVDDVLRQVPGFSIFRRSSSLVANPTTQGVSLRGAGASGASRTLVLNDGVPLNDAFGGWVYWGRVARLALEQVEIVRGGASDLYGSDALSGVINVISKPAPQRHVSAEASYGTRGTQDVAFHLSDRWGKFAAALSGEAFKTDGYFLVAPAQRGTADQAAASRHRNLGLRLQYNWQPDAQVFARGSLFDEDRRNGTQVQRNDTATEGAATGLRVRTRDGSEWQFTLFAHQQRYHQNFTAVAANRNSETLTRLQFIPARDAGVSALWSRPSFGRHLLVVGADVRGVRGTSDETVFVAGRATTFVSAGGRQRRAGVFAQDIIALTSKLSLTASARFDTWRDSSAASVERTLATGAVRPRFFTPRETSAFNPRLALHYAPRAAFALRAAAYRAFRAPTLNELYRSFRVGDTLTQANENLIAERLTGGEAGADWRWRNALRARATGFFTETVNPISNFTLSATPTLITRERRNLGRTRATGLEAELEAQPHRHWQFTAGYLFVAATVRQAPQDARLIGLTIPQVPRHQFTLQAAYNHPRWLTAALQLRTVGTQFDDDQNRLPLARFTIADVTLARPLTRWLEAFLAIQNIANTQFLVARTPLENYGMPRLVRGGLRLRWE